MQAAVGGLVPYPNLQSIANLFRFKINDTFNSVGGSGVAYGGGAGLIMPNTNPDLITLLDTAIQDTYSDLRNVGSPGLILDNYILTGLPVFQSNLGVGVVNPATQVSIAYMGYFDGVIWWPNWTLPISTQKVLAVWERQSGLGDNNFTPMTQAPNGIGGVQQGQHMGRWEMRQGQIWMPGCVNVTDIRLRVRISYPEFLNPVNINYETAYVPIVGSRNAIVAKMLTGYAERFAPERLPAQQQREEYFMGKLLNESVRQGQSQENRRASFGDAATQDFAAVWPLW